MRESGTSKERNVTRKEQRITNNEWQVTNNKQTITNNERKLTSNEQRAKGLATIHFRGNAYLWHSFHRDLILPLLYFLCFHFSLRYIFLGFQICWRCSCVVTLPLNKEWFMSVCKKTIQHFACLFCKVYFPYAFLYSNNRTMYSLKWMCPEWVNELSATSP